jgi:hypothetical protein
MAENENDKLSPAPQLQSERVSAPKLRAARRPAGQARRTSRAGVPLAKWRCPHALSAVPEDGALPHFACTSAGEHSLALSCPRCLIAIVRRLSRCTLRPATVKGDSGGSGGDAPQTVSSLVEALAKAVAEVDALQEVAAREKREAAAREEALLEQISLALASKNRQCSLVCALM